MKLWDHLPLLKKKTYIKRILENVPSQSPFKLAEFSATDFYVGFSPRQNDGSTPCMSAFTIHQATLGLPCFIFIVVLETISKQLSDGYQLIMDVLKGGEARDRFATAKNKMKVSSSLEYNNSQNLFYDRKNHETNSSY